MTPVPNRSSASQNGPENGPEDSSDELVVLVDEQGRQTGTARKATVHDAHTPLHRAFSCYAFDPDGRLLLTCRADGKATFPSLWTNTVCGHPAPGESDLAALIRRARQELGVLVRDVTPALPGFRYRAESGGIVENEICPVYLATVDDEPQPDPSEVGQVRWTSWPRFLAELGDHPDRFSPWCRLQTSDAGLHRAVRRHLAPHALTAGRGRLDTAPAPDRVEDTR